MIASAAGVSSAPEIPCSARATIRTPIDGAAAHSAEPIPNPSYAGGEHAPLSEPVGERAGQEDQRAERQQVGVGDPLLGGESAAEVTADRRERDVDGRGVDRGDRRGQDRRDQRQALVRLVAPLGHHRLAASIGSRARNTVRPGT